MIAEVLSGARPWALVHGDCIAWHPPMWPVTGLASLPDGSVDHVITDPPYDEHTHKAQRRGHTGYVEGQKSSRATFNRVRHLGFYAITTSEMESLGDEAARVSRRWTLAFCAIEQVSDWRGALSSADLEAVRVGVWVKLNPTPQFTGDRPGSGVEAIVIAAQPGRKRWNGGGRPAVWTAPIVLNRGNGEDRIHPTQKPEALMEALIRDFTDPGDLVVDPFAGSGTTGVACIRLGRRFIGWERDPKFYAVAFKRLSETHEQPELVAHEAFRREAKKKRKQMGLALPDPEAA